MKRNAFIIFNLLLILFLGVGCVGHPEQPSQQVATIPVESTEASKELSTAAANNTKLPLTKTAHKSNMSKGDVIGSEHVSTDAPVTILAGNVTLLIDSGAVSNEVEISIVATTEDNSGRIPENLTNLTADGAVYRMLPDGQQFEKDITIAMRYDSTALPYGCTADDIYTFFYNEQRHMWQQVERDSVDKQKQIVYSRTNHFTDYINGVLKVPENSDAMAYTPTSIKDLKAADPMEGITLIAPPEANNHGTTNLTYPLTIPAGRRGMQPQLAISYNSAGGSGILGLGWSLPISEISVDTRRGVPWYSDTLESETYTLDGEVLVTAYTDSNHLLHLNKPAYSIPWKHRSNADTMRFYPRVEGSFRRIERIGTSTDSYHWIVTDKNGIKYYYGEVDSARLKDEYGNIAKWCLNRVSDTYGNEITYTYTTYIDTVPRSGNISRQIIIKCINYTAYNRPPAEQGRYNVRFIYAEEDKIDAVTSGRYGFLEADAALLDHIIIEHNNTPIKYYVFGYKYGAFGKTLLCNIAEVSPDVFLSQCADCTGSFKDGRHNFHLPNYEFCGDNKYFDTIDSIRSERERPRRHQLLHLPGHYTVLRYLHF